MWYRGTISYLPLDWFKLFNQGERRMNQPLMVWSLSQATYLSVTATNWGRVRSFASASCWAAVQSHAPEIQVYPHGLNQSVGSEKSSHAPLTSLSGTTWSWRIGVKNLENWGKDMQTNNVKIACEGCCNIIVWRNPVAGPRGARIISDNIGTISNQNGCQRKCA